MESKTTEPSNTQRPNKLTQFGYNLWSAINKQVVLNRSLIEAGTELAKGVALFTLHKKPAFILEGAMGAFREIAGSTYYAEDFFVEKNGWKPLSFEGINITYLFIPALESFPHKSLTFKYADRNSARLVETPLGKIGVIEQNEGRYSNSNIFYRPSETNIEALRQFLIEHFISRLNSNCLSVVEGSDSYYETSINIVPEDLISFHSKRTEEYIDYIKVCLDKNINRSFLFYGAPGCGKTTLASSILKELGFRTLRFRYSEYFDFSLLKFLIRAFKVDAILVDDMDTISENEKLLEFLEFVNRETKLVIGIANTLDDLFPPLLRPGRFSKVIKIDALETEAIKEIMGPLYKTYGTKVKKWPVAYIKELMQRKVIDREDMLDVFTELDERVKKQLKMLAPKEKRN